MDFLYFYLIFLVQLFLNFTYVYTNTQSSPWSCNLGSENRLECRNLYNFYLSSYSLCRDDHRLLTQQNIDELLITNDYNCFDHSYHCYFEFDSSWTMCLNSLRKLTIENLSFIVRLYNPRKLLAIDYLKIVNTHGSITELLHQFQFSNRSSIYIQNPYPRWSGIDLYMIYIQSSLIVFKQLWINVVDWYPIIYMNYDHQNTLRQWLLKIPCLHIELGECRSYYHDMIYLRDLFNSRQERTNELFCYKNQGSDRFHWSKVPELYYNYIIPRRPTSYLLPSTELHENCFDQFTKPRYTINSNTDLQEFYSHFHTYETYSIPLWTLYPYATLPNLPTSTTIPTTTIVFGNRSSYPSTLDYINLYDYAYAFNETRWLSAVEAYPDGRFLVIDNRNQQVLLLNENGTYKIDLTPIFFRQIYVYNRDVIITPALHDFYSLSQIYVDADSYAYIIPSFAHYIYIFSSDNRLIRCLTPLYLGISIIRSDCFTISHTGVIYICDDTYRVVRIYTRMGIAQKIIRLDYLPLKLFISNNRLFTYSLERLAHINMYTLSGTPIRTLTMCSYNIPSEVIWFRGKYFLTCGIYLYVLDEHGNQIAEHSFHTLLYYPETYITIHDIAINKNGVFLATFRRNGTLFNRYWIIRPTIL